MIHKYTPAVSPLCLESFRDLVASDRQVIAFNHVQLYKRLNTTYWRNVPYNGTRFIFSTVIALLLGCILWDIGTERSTVQQFSNILGALYLAVLFLGIINAMSVQPIVEMERTVCAGAGCMWPGAQALRSCNWF